ncbi:MAG: HlyD family efflux transporter periplasmic adaptor subunit [Henriciella sp.]|nr:HlyD family efflux transporter periplasmic adaptor subunit [Henriciella sp.]
MTLSTRSSIAGLGLLLLAACSGETPEDINTGYVEADWVYIAAPQSGWLVEQTISEGDTIAVGDTLFRLDTDAEQAALAEAQARVRQSGAEARNIESGARAPEIRALQARLAEAEARLVRAVTDRDRIMPLVEAGVEPSGLGEQLNSDVAAAEAAVEALKQDIAVATLAGRPAAREAADAATESAQASVESAQYRLNQRTIISQVSGRVEEVFLTQGEYATAGAQVLAVLPADGMKVRFFVPQAELPQIAMGDSIQVTADGLGAPTTATVSYISASAEFTPPVIYSRNVRDKLVFLIEADLPSSTRLLPGLPVEVNW